MDLQIIKRGETCLHVVLSRPLKHVVPGVGLMVQVKAHHAIEDFMKNSLGDGKTTLVEAVSRGWIGGETPLSCYNSINNCSYGGNTISFDLKDIGGALYKADTVNLSFLRLVGISEPQGVTFYLKGIYSLEHMRMMKEKIAAATRAFYQEYLRPADMAITVSTQELSV